jgi:glucosamine-6-phosphate deaminase
MEIIIQPTAAAATRIAARLLAKQLKEKPDLVLGLATGSTPLLLYRELVALKLDWRKVKTFNLDEYIGISPQHPQSYHSFMWENLFRHVNIAAKNVHIPDGMAKDIPASCELYEKRIREAGGIDLQVLGIGTDGHIGFNEPSSSLVSRTRIKTLTQQTVKDNAHYFGREDDVPRHVITMGIGTILEARENVMLAFGGKKAAVVAAAVEGPVTAINPASALQMHEKTKVFLDAAAATKLQRSDYYHWVYDHKPQWQHF